jgi:P27 family predicted phage terminase small subunit
MPKKAGKKVTKAHRRSPKKKPAASSPKIAPAACELDPPPELAGEAVLEWARVCAELTKLKTLDAADRAILIQYCEIWSVNRACSAVVRSVGSTMEYSNGMVGATPAYKNMIQTAALLRGLLSDIGLTRYSRKDRGGNGSTFTLDLD